MMIETKTLRSSHRSGAIINDMSTNRDHIYREFVVPRSVCQVRSSREEKVALEAMPEASLFPGETRSAIE